MIRAGGAVRRNVARSSGGARGALDGLPSASTVYSLRKLRAGYVGPLVNIRRSSDNAQQDFYPQSDGSFPVGAFSTFIAAGSGFITKWYDQSGGGFDVVQATAANQPQLIASAQGGRPTVRFSAASSQRLISASSVTIATAVTAMAVAKRASAAANGGIFGINFTAPGTLGASVFYATNASQDWAGGDMLAVGNGFLISQNPRFVATTPAASTDGLSHIVESVLSAATATLLIDGTAQTARASATGAVPSQTAVVNVGVTSVGDGSYMDGDIPELIVWSSEVSSANRATVRANQKSYYGTP